MPVASAMQMFNLEQLHEIDVVITRAHVLTGRWDKLYDEVRAFREACGDAHMKTVIISTKR